MTMKKLQLTDDQIEDIRFCLAYVAQENEDRVQHNLSLPDSGAYTFTLEAQAERFRALARAITA